MPHSSGLFRVLTITAFLLAAITSASAQQLNYLVTAPDSSVSVFDLTTNNLVKKINQGSNEYSIVVGPNSRLAFVGSKSYVSVIDLTIGREVQRIRNVGASTIGSSMTLTRDGRYLLVVDTFNLGLAIIDPVALTLVREVPLSVALGDGVYSMGTVVSIGSKAYVTSDSPDQINPAIAVVDLNTFTARGLSIPPGFYGYQGLGALPDAAITADGRYFVLAQDSGSYHLLFFNCHRSACHRQGTV
jgi:hypothetical protein